MDITSLQQEYDAVLQELQNPALISDWERFQELSKKKARMEKILKKSQEAEDLRTQLQENLEMLGAEDQPELLSLAEEELKTLQEKLKAMKDAYWNDVYALDKGSAYHYFLQSAASGTGNPFLVISGEETVTASGLSFLRYFYIDAVNRGNCGVGNISTSTATFCSNPGNGSPSDIAVDPSTLKVTVVASSTNQIATNLVGYITRSRNSVFVQTDWSSGSGQEYFPTSSLAQQSSSSASITQTDESATQTGFNLSGAAFVNTEVVGTGDGASIRLSPQ